MNNSKPPVSFNINKKINKIIDIFDKFTDTGIDKLLENLYFIFPN
jgi:hypothetical protein